MSATDHVHANEGILESLSHNCNSHLVLVGNGFPITVTKTGHCHFPLKNPYRPLHLHNILIIPTIIKKILSMF